ncbi:carbohydrate ABC transporter substrate-binding protein [Sulfitobacter mediterraneus]|jgi:glucose/mannose transport system substrate-binding protein|uniref:ABC transporter substrate-binding protein n=1 Tax=Sulfitobacter TaxID=60136 RepID=UPI0019342D51|nr:MULTISPECIES: ABC transporter substrate-binding protein [Sulfitobacter]MBM1631392.1 carbohydrate ABC transporter substrate-binding protein [Sulfitobacter mediterraneus]MBM1639207.1 carbohydrate ABC transporter substrate-binding protein [Sulfitobacter mediterraneus]MBM1643256.1 carbohydrate ABC transporter substrate-binding protein [Sulfitobacter mediterraneus]MBM1647302.1 carbohydrate ABC transporter substrate-binding protein [Sulfitobacter mediterraneus]MBM1651347.1 carbohydrate ABC transp
MKSYALGIACGVALGTSGAAFAEPQAEVLHYWTSGGEAKSVAVLQEEFAANGGTWTDMPVAGGGGDAAMTALRARVLSGNAPTAVQLKGPAIQEWYEEGVLADISAVAEANNWEAVLPASIAGHMKCEGTWCAAPVNVHRVDWIWANANVLEANGIEMPTSWDAFNAAADKLQAAGIIPLAHGGQAWQDATVFEAVALGILGAEGFHKAFVELDKDTLTSDAMVATFDQMRKMRGYVDPNFSGRDWNLATAMVMNGEAAFQIMGDWAKGEFMAAGKAPGEDFLCASTPGDGFLYNVDSFAMFEVGGADKQAGQALLAELVVGKNFQKVFNLNKGSIPARTDVPLDEFDSCAVLSAADMAASSENGSLLPSYAHGMALRGAQAGAITDVVTAHFNSDMSSADAVQMLAEAVANSM